MWISQHFIFKFSVNASDCCNVALDQEGLKTESGFFVLLLGISPDFNLTQIGEKTERLPPYAWLHSQQLTAAVGVIIKSGQLHPSHRHYS